MVVLTGLSRPAGPRAFSMAFRLLMQITGRRSAKLALSSGQQMADRTGSVRPVGPRAFCGASRLRTPIMAQRLVTMDRPFEQQTGEARDSTSQAERQIRFWEFLLPTKTMGRLWVILAQSLEQLMEGTTGLRRSAKQSMISGASLLPM